MKGVEGGDRSWSLSPVWQCVFRDLCYVLVGSATFGLLTLGTHSLGYFQLELPRLQGCLWYILKLHHALWSPLAICSSRRLAFCMKEEQLLLLVWLITMTTASLPPYKGRIHFALLDWVLNPKICQFKLRSKWRISLQAYLSHNTPQNTNTYSIFRTLHRCRDIVGARARTGMCWLFCMAKC